MESRGLHAPMGAFQNSWDPDHTAVGTWLTRLQEAYVCFGAGLLDHKLDE